MANDSVRADATEQAPPANPLAQMYEQSFEDMRHLVCCKVCVQPMYEPYTIACGHTFCYSCLVQWFETNKRNKTCPECRKSVTQQPAPAYIVRELARLFSAKSELLAPGETTKEHEDIRSTEASVVAKDKENTSRPNGGLFRGLFPVAQRWETVRGHRPFIDVEDNVERCPFCHWELETDFCFNCDIHLRHPMSGSGSPHTSVWDHDNDYDSWENEHILRAGARHPSVSIDSHAASDSDDYDSGSQSEDSAGSLGSFIDDNPMMNQDSDGTDLVAWRHGRASDNHILAEFEAIRGRFPSDSDASSEDDGWGQTYTSRGVPQFAERTPLPRSNSDNDSGASPERLAIRNYVESTGLMTSEDEGNQDDGIDNDNDEDDADEDDYPSDDDEEAEDEETERDAEPSQPEPPATQQGREGSRKRRRLVVEDSSSSEDDSSTPTGIVPSSTRSRIGNSQQGTRMGRRNRSRPNRNSPPALLRRAHGLSRASRSVAQVQ